VCCYCGKAQSKEIHHVHYARPPVWVLKAIALWVGWFILAVVVQQPLLLLPWLPCSIVVFWPNVRITDREIIGWDVFPVCGSQNEQGSCHWRLHLNTNWVRDKTDPTWRNHNNWMAVYRLRIGWLLLNQSVRAKRRSSRRDWQKSDRQVQAEFKQRSRHAK
jgi:hypothetical protein